MLGAQQPVAVQAFQLDLMPRPGARAFQLHRDLFLAVEQPAVRQGVRPGHVQVVEEGILIVIVDHLAQMIFQQLPMQRLGEGAAAHVVVHVVGDQPVLGRRHHLVIQFGRTGIRRFAGDDAGRRRAERQELLLDPAGGFVLHQNFATSTIVITRSRMRIGSRLMSLPARSLARLSRIQIRASLWVSRIFLISIS